MKKFVVAALLVPLTAFAQSFPSPTFSSLTLQNPLSSASGGTGAANAGAISVGGDFTVSGANPVTLTTTGTTSITLPTSGTLLNGTTGATAGANSNITSLSGLTTPLSVPQGGIGKNSLTAHGVAIGAGTSAINVTAAGAAGTLFAGNGASADPSFQTLSSLGIAPLASPAFTGTPSAPTAPLGTNTTQVATTAFVASHSDCASILDFGGNNLGAANNDAAYVATIVANQATHPNNVCIFFPAGTYNFASQAAFGFPNAPGSITVRGAGADNTVLNWANGGGLSFNYLLASNSVHVDGLTIASGALGVGQGIFLNQSSATFASAALSTITNVTIRGTDGYFGAKFFGIGIDIRGVSNVNIDHVQAIGPGTPAGTGVLIASSGTLPLIVFNLSNSSFDQWNVGLEYGNLVQGVQMSNMNFTNNVNGVRASGGLSGLDQLSIVGSQFNSVANGFNILLQSAIPNVQIANNLFLINSNSSGVDLQSALSTTTITGNSFESNTGSTSGIFGIIVNGFTNGGTIITGNSFFTLGSGITLQAASRNVNVQSNVYINCVTTVDNSGTSNVIGGGSP
ncbi:Phage tail fiber protein [Caballeronia glathei]|uniref:Pectate lyase superfamily protein domain-containing protein n=1 Tax=Caballeronia glathei TaxID=60547 RepID=A0A069PNY8_9BURK|nr:hypothetical protein [Caballeronia glathei]KDR41584.1 hypothetical protein BG61_16660 [Caballeronia glathei]CDY79492.1 Phage tail fiber protein [Caballeronia glathei]